LTDFNDPSQLILDLCGNATTASLAPTVVAGINKAIVPIIAARNLAINICPIDTCFRQILIMINLFYN
jgi:hypothetical protein